MKNNRLPLTIAVSILCVFTFLMACGKEPQPNAPFSQSAFLSWKPSSTAGVCSGCKSQVTVSFSCDNSSVQTSSCKDLSNVVVKFSDGTHQKFDGLSGKSDTFMGTGSFQGKTIVGVWVKSGCNSSGDGPGYGQYFANDKPSSSCPVSSPEPSQPDAGSTSEPKSSPDAGTPEVTPKEPSVSCSGGEIDRVLKAFLKTGGCIGKPISNERTLLKGNGCFRHHVKGSMFWSVKTGAHPVYGGIWEHWLKFGNANGFLGYPIEEETDAGKGKGRKQAFQYGDIYWAPNIPAAEIHGAIRAAWLSLGGVKGFLGYPTSDEKVTPDSKGRMQTFESGEFYWSATTGAFEVHGGILAKWKALGGVKSCYGYPITHERNVKGGQGRESVFQGGTIRWSPQSGMTLHPKPKCIK